MKKEEIISEFLRLVKEREDMGEVRAELEVLERDEKVKRYLSLREYFEDVKKIENYSDNELFDLVINRDNESLDDIWFCCGKNFWGHMRRVGTYYIENNNKAPFARLSVIQLARYRNLKDVNEEVIIPVQQTEEFENGKKIVYASNCFPDEEYEQVRRKMYLEYLDGTELEGQKILVKR